MCPATYMLSSSLYHESLVFKWSLGDYFYPMVVTLSFNFKTSAVVLVHLEMDSQIALSHKKGC